VTRRLQRAAVQMRARGELAFTLLLQDDADATQQWRCSFKSLSALLDAVHSIQHACSIQGSTGHASRDRPALDLVELHDLSSKVTRTVVRSGCWIIDIPPLFALGFDGCVLIQETAEAKAEMSASVAAASPLHGASWAPTMFARLLLALLQTFSNTSDELTGWYSGIARSSADCSRLFTPLRHVERECLFFARFVAGASRVIEQLPLRQQFDAAQQCRLSGKAYLALIAQHAQGLTPITSGARGAEDGAEEVTVPLLDGTAAETDERSVVLNVADIQEFAISELAHLNAHMKHVLVRIRERRGELEHRLALSMTRLLALEALATSALLAFDVLLCSMSIFSMNVLERYDHIVSFRQVTGVSLLLLCWLVVVAYNRLEPLIRLAW
jgi:hypothetical protein